MTHTPGARRFRFAVVVFASITAILGLPFVVVDGFQWSSAPLVIAFALVFTIVCLMIVIPSSRWREVLDGNLGSLSACVFGLGIPYFAWGLHDHQLVLYVFVVAMGELASLTAPAFDLRFNVGFFGLSCAAVLAAFSGLVVSLFAQREGSRPEDARR